MKTLYQIFLSALAGACAALLIMKFTEEPPVIPEQQSSQQTQSQSWQSPIQAQSQTEPQPQLLREDVKLPVSTAITAPDFNPAITRAMPAVVCISIQRVVGVRGRNFFDSRMQYYSVPAGTGSGFFVHPDGYILTNYHVIKGVRSSNVFVTDMKGTEYPATIIGADPASDLAMIKVSAKNNEKFPTLSFAAPDSVKIGNWAIAIGAPFDLEFSVTAGIVSGVHRSSVGVNVYENYIQTDASINPGNSGGPLLNANGDVIGVNDCILTPNSGSIGISFAVSSEIAKTVAENLITKGHIDRSWLGIMANLPNVIRNANQPNQPQEKGTVVRDVLNNSPAINAGIRRGDTILAVDGKEISSSMDLRNKILETQPGTKIKLTVKRGNETGDIEIELVPTPQNWFQIVPTIDYATPI